MKLVMTGFCNGRKEGGEAAVLGDGGTAVVHAAGYAAVLAAANAKLSCRVIAAVAAASVRAAAGAYRSQPLEEDEGLEERKSLASAAVQAHSDLHKISGTKQRNMGMALAAAKPNLPPDIAKAMRRLQRISNTAKHEWSEDTSCGNHTVSSSQQRVL